jgi:hypothetical protein
VNKIGKQNQGAFDALDKQWLVFASFWHDDTDSRRQPSYNIGLCPRCPKKALPILASECGTFRCLPPPTPCGRGSIAHNEYRARGHDGKSSFCFEKFLRVQFD